MVIDRLRALGDSVKSRSSGLIANALVLGDTVKADTSTVTPTPLIDICIRPGVTRMPPTFGYLVVFGIRIGITSPRA